MPDDHHGFAREVGTLPAHLVKCPAVGRYVVGGKQRELGKVISLLPLSLGEAQIKRQLCEQVYTWLAAQPFARTAQPPTPGDCRDAHELVPLWWSLARGALAELVVIVTSLTTDGPQGILTVIRLSAYI